MSSVDQAVRLVRQAVLQDSKRNYQEAARCYSEAILTFRELKHSRHTSRRLQDLLAAKLGQYEDRLKILEQHLLSTTDLTKFFKELKPTSSRSSVSSESKQLYKNPLLGKALDLLKRGRKEDERKNFSQALIFYEAGLGSLLDILRRGHLTERQTESARVKCLLYHERAESIRNHLEDTSVALERGRAVSEQEEEDLEDSDCDSPVPPTESDKMLQMEEVVSCSSRLGSTQSLFDDKQQQRLNRSFSSSSISRSSSSMSRGSSSPLAAKPSTHSLYPTCEIKSSPSVLSMRSDYRGGVPLAKIDKEMDLSCLSLHHDEEEIEDTEQILVIHEDCDESYELIRLKEKDEDANSEGSDSGYSDPSPDGTIRDSKSPGSEEDSNDRKSPFSDISEEMLEDDEIVAKVPLVPDIIVVKEGNQGKAEELEASPRIPRRHLGRQTSRFQTEGKGILVSQKSQDEVAVLGEDQVDMARMTMQRMEMQQEVYGRRINKDERVPVRAEARGEHGDMNMGCYYLMAALDFCWCL